MQVFKGYMIAYTIFAVLTGIMDSIYVFIPETRKPLPMWIARGYLKLLLLIYIIAFLYWLLRKLTEWSLGARCFLRIFRNEINDLPHRAPE